jgi:ATP/maltotriose-dependent transcriptional regulator MalT
MNIHLLETKFHIAPWRVGAVSRPRLLEHISIGLSEGRKLTLVSAPAGYGKTTLISEWIHSLALSEEKRHFAWLSLEEADDDPERFFRYWLSALVRADGSLSGKIQPLLNLPELPSTNALLDALLNELAKLEAPLLLALDDYHVITTPQIHQAMEYFIDHQPAHIHLVLTTRVDPPLPLGRLRGRVRDRGPQNMDAGRQQRFIETFRGSHRYVLDYLAEEVIRQQGFAIIQSTVEPDMQARIFSLLSSVGGGMAPIGLLIAGPVADLVGIQAWFLIGGALCVLMAGAGVLTSAVMHIEERRNAVLDQITPGMEPTL